MKHLAFLTLLALLIGGCTPKLYEYQYEEKLFNCFYAENVYIKDNLNELEQAFIEAKILEDGSGESYIASIERMRNDLVQVIFNTPLREAISKVEYMPSFEELIHPSCLSLIDTTELNQSRLKHFINIINEMESQPNVSYKAVVDQSLEYYTAKDFEQESYKSLYLLVIVTFIENNKSKPLIELPTWEPENTDLLPKRNILKIKVTAQDEILVDDKAITRKELKSIVKVFFIKKCDKEKVDFPSVGQQDVLKGIIALQSDESTSYQLYLNVYNELKAVYKELRDERSNLLFQKDFDQLNDQKKKMIKQMIPFVISEAEPTGSGE